MKIILFLLSGAFFNVLCWGQDGKTAAADSFFQRIHQWGQLNGNVLVAQNGKLVYQGSFGYADFSAKRMNDSNSRFSLGSVSKIFTAVAILQLKEKGQLRLDDPLVKYLPGFRYPAITIRHLLSHTSGLPDYELYGKLVDQNPQKIFGNADILPALAAWQKPLYFIPGEKWQYSNTNFSLLALVVERLSRMRFQEYISRYIFRPAKMVGSYFLTDTIKIPDKHRAINHQYATLFAAEPENVEGLAKLRWRLYNLSGFTGQGNIISSADDLLRFDQALYSGKIIGAAALEEAFTAAKLNNGEPADADIGIGKASYGLGSFIFSDTSAGKIVWHGGGVPGAVAIFLRNITKKQVVVILDNAFSEGIYKNGRNAMDLLNHQPITVRKKSLTQEYGSTLVKEGIDVAYCRLFQLRADTVHYYLDEEDMNLLGYQLLYEAKFDNHQKLSLEVFKLNTLLFPGSYNAYDSYGEALHKNGYKQQAIIMYRHALKLKPGNKESVEALERILKE